MGLYRQRVLIIDDNVEEIELLRVALESMGFDPEIIIDPNMAEEILAERSMQAIIIDLDNTKVEPYRWVKKFTDENPSRPVVGITEKTLKQVAPRLARYGGRALIRKPIDPDGVVAEIQKAFAPQPARRARPSTQTKRKARASANAKRVSPARTGKAAKRATTGAKNASGSKRRKTRATTAKGR